jgi:3-deoxy-7-phosphoheptulonate synthase
MTLSPKTWSPNSWQGLPILQQPDYADPAAVETALATVRELPPLVSPGEVDALRQNLAKAAIGKAFLLQGGDCAERFADCRRDTIENKLKILLQMSLVLTWGAQLPVIRVGRMAGQYAKPRSKPTEIVNGVEVPSYRGDHINGHDPSERTHNPQRLVDAYFHSASTLNYIRALLDGGFADLHNPGHWDLGFVRSAARRAGYEKVIERILEALTFLESAGASGGDAFKTVEFYSSHEGLILPWEEAQTEQIGGRYYNLGAHMLWIGHRTRSLDGAHVEYFRGIANPIGVKVGPGTTPEGLCALLDRLDPDDVAGKITLIARFGADRVATDLPPLVHAVHATGRTVVWSCDPMHGNTVTADNGLKTRDAGRVLSEVNQSLALHDQLGGVLGGVHFELTGENVTECIGGPEELQVADLSRSYETYCDPRLNYAQSLEMAFLLARGLRDLRGRS